MIKILETIKNLFSKEPKDMTVQEIREMNKRENVKFERHCGACLNFGDPEMCPFFEKVYDNTIWKKIGCTYFED